MTVLEKAEALLRKYFGYPSFREEQSKIIDSILQGRDTIGLMPTGGGKSICYQIPSLLFKGVTLVISPLISLMKDQVDALQRIGLPATYLNSSLDNRELEERMKRIKMGEYKLVYLTPERLETDSFHSLMQVVPISMVAIDEAHCISQWGHDFRPSYLLIVNLLEKLKQRPIVSAFTATATPEVRQDIIDRLKIQHAQIFGTSLKRDNLSFSVIKGENKQDFLIKYLREHKEQSGIIYASTRKDVESVYDILQGHGFSVGKYHAGLTDQERKDFQDAFLFDDTPVMAATNAFGMGINKSNVRFVIHYNMPKNMEAYYQEAGRAGRDGLESESYLLFAPQDIQTQKFLIEQSDTTIEKKTNEYRKLQSMIDYCYTPRCLQNYILQYFGEIAETDCGKCSNCSDYAELIDITKEAQIIFSCIRRMKERFGVAMVAKVLKGSQSKKLQQFGFQQLSTYGLLKDYTEKKIVELIQLLVAEGYLAVTESQYPVVSLSQNAIPVLKGEEKVLQKIRIKKVQTVINEPLFQKLSSLRKQLAQAENVPPYIIFSDSTLREMSTACPTNEQELLLIKGVGEIKFSKYGPSFLRLVSEHVEEYGMLQSTSAGSINTFMHAKKPSHHVTWELYQEGKSLEQIAKEREISLLTVEKHLFQCGEEDFPLDWSMFIQQEFETLILSKIKEVGFERLKPIKELLPDEVNYTSIRAVIGKYKMANPS